ncbi:hypothetical protein BGZ90_009578, partial [Linnemannia elongata]
FDTGRAQDETQEYSQGGSEAQSSRDDHCTRTLILHRQGHGNNSSRVSSTSHDSTPDGSEERSTESRSITLGHHYPVVQGQGEPRLVGHPVQLMERVVLDSNTNTTGCLHRCVDQRLGHCYQRRVVEWSVVRNGQGSTHQLARVADNLQGGQAAPGAGEDDQLDGGQHHHHCLCQQVRRNSVASTDGVSGADLATLPSNRNQTQNHIRPLPLQPSGCTLPTD